MLFLRVFGGLSLENGGRPIVGAAGQRGRLAILAALATAGDQGLSRDALQSLFWPESNLDRARGALKQALYALRRDTGETDLTAGSSELRLNSSVIQSDVGRFDDAIRAGDLKTAVELYRGPFLHGIHLRGQAEFERWTDKQRDRLAASHLNVARKLALDLERRGDYSAASEQWRRLSETEPLDGKIAASYMKALAAGGEHHAAVKFGRRHVELVRSELEASANQDVLRILSDLTRARMTATEPAHRFVSPGSTVELPDVSSAPVADIGSWRMESAASLAAPAAGGIRAARWWIVGIAGGTLVAAVMIAFAVLPRKQAPSKERALIMVAPFADASGDQRSGPLGGIVADWITQGLASSSLVAVIDPGTGAAALKELQKSGIDPLTSVRDLARATGASSVITGAIYRTRDSLQFHARLTDRDGRVRAAMTPVVVAAGNEMKGIELVGQRILGQLAKTFDARFADLVSLGGPPPLFSAYQEYVIGVSLLTDGDNAGALVRFRNAYRLDSAFVTPLVWAVHAHSNLGQSSEAIALADSLASRSDRLIPLDRYAVLAQHADFHNDEPGKIEYAKAAAKIAPKSQWPWLAGQWLLIANRPREALQLLSLIEPTAGWMNSPDWASQYWQVKSTAYHMLGDGANALRSSLRARAIDPESMRTEVAIARDYAMLGQTAEMWTEVARMQSLNRPYGIEAFRRLVLDLTRHEKKDLARAVRDTAMAYFRNQLRKPDEDDARPLAQMHFDLDQLDKAKPEFERILRRYPKSEWAAHYHGFLGIIAANEGDTLQARKIADAIPADGVWPGGEYYWRARIEAQLGHRQLAVQLLKTSLAKGAGQMWIWHSRGPDFPTLAGYPPFEELMKENPSDVPSSSVALRH
ncbi:MAG: BTAD domain-containing putative transcriptional regulator [Gemmatimonadaceae bacterium]